VTVSSKKKHFRQK